MSSRYGRDYGRGYESGRSGTDRDYEYEGSRGGMNLRERERNIGGRGRDDERYGRERGYGSTIGSRMDYGTGRDYKDYGYGRERGYGLTTGSRMDYGTGRDYEDYGYGREGGYGSMAGSYGRRDYPTGRDFEDYGYGRERDYARDYLSRMPRREGYSGSEYGRGYGGAGSYGGGSYGSRSGRDYERGTSGGRGEERSWWDRATDMVSSWFGDEEAERRRHMDEMRAQHRGRGPRGYRRSDDRVKEDINDRLSDDWYLDATEIEVAVINGEVTLTGSVMNRTDKRRAEDIADAVSGVTNVENRLRVSPSSMSTTTTTGTTSATVTTGTSAAAGAGSTGTGTSGAGRTRGATT
jgi:osmotically-inducible protein OsmY